MGYICMNKEIVLSILLPVYNYPEGAARILDRLDLLSAPTSIINKIEVIIFDDSDDEGIKGQVEKIQAGMSYVKYKSNSPSLGACNNWNSLIREARGEYYILIHHDEFPLVENFLLKVLKEIKKNNGIDIIMMDCLLVDRGSGSLRRHVPSFIRVQVFKHFPEYLFLRNVIGPTASLIVKKSLHSSFDCSLSWLIDVDEYYRLRQSAKSFIFLTDLKIVSYIDKGNSITSSLKGRINHIKQQELKRLIDKNLQVKPYLIRNKAALFLESIIWVGMRIVTRSYWFVLNSVGKYPVSKNMAKKAFYDD
jgi:glycosyltransferase involved in cell wall biosynthesis